MKRFAIASIVVLLAAVAVAQQKTYLDTTGLETLLAALQQDGDYHLTVKGGVVTVFPIQVITLTSSKPNPKPPSSSLREISSTRAAAHPEHTRDLIVATTVVVARHEAVPFSNASAVQDAYQAARDRVLNSESKRTLWQDWLTATRDQLLKMGQEGRLQTADQYVAAVTQIRDGLSDSMQGMRAEAANIGELLKLVFEVLDLVGKEGVSLSAIIKIVLALLESMGQQFTTGV